MKKIILFGCLILASLFFVAPARAEYVCTDNLCYYHGDFQVGFYEPICGNNVSETGEQCDGIALPARSCYEFLGNDWVGDVKCKSDCKLDITSCKYTKTSVQTQKEDHESKSKSSNNNHVSSNTNQASSTQFSEIPLNPGINTIELGRKYVFYSNSEQHKLWLKNIAENSATFGIASEEKEMELNEGELQEININEEPSPDIGIRLNSIKQNSAEISFELLPTQNQAEEAVSGDDGNPSKVRTVTYIILALVVVAIITALFIMRRKNGNTN